MEVQVQLDAHSIIQNQIVFPHKPGPPPYFQVWRWNLSLSSSLPQSLSVIQLRKGRTWPSIIKAVKQNSCLFHYWVCIWGWGWFQAVHWLPFPACSYLLLAPSLSEGIFSSRSAAQTVIVVGASMDRKQSHLRSDDLTLYYLTWALVERIEWCPKGWPYGNTLVTYQISQSSERADEVTQELDI